MDPVKVMTPSTMYNALYHKTLCIALYIVVLLRDESESVVEFTQSTHRSIAVVFVQS